MINRFDRQNTHANSELSRDLEAAFAAVAKKHNIEIKLGSGSYNPAMLQVKLVCRIKDTQVANTVSAFTLRSLGLPENAIGREFVWKGQMHTVMGINTKKRRYPVETRRADGQYINFTAGCVARILGTGTGG